MDITKALYASFPFEWTVKSTSYQIRYKKAFSINEIDEIFCGVINTKGNQISISELGSLLGFNLEDLAEIDILNIYLKGLTEYNLIEISQAQIQLTELGQEALNSKLKYKYFNATTAVFENQTAAGESFDFSFKNAFDLENGLTPEKKTENTTFQNPGLEHKLQFQVFGNDIYKGEIIELYEGSPSISFKSISLQCEIISLYNTLQLSIYKSGVNRPDIQFLIDLSENEELKTRLIRKGMFYHLQTEKPSITVQDIETYIDLWNWKELAKNPRIDWNNKTVFKLFLENGDGSVWSVISEKAPIDNIKSVIQEYAEYWNWTTLTERFDSNFIREQIKTFNWDFEELSYKETDLIISALSTSELKDRGWDWSYLSKNLPDKFIEEHIEDCPWDYHEITVGRNEVFKSTFIKYRDRLEILISKNWNWDFISREVNINFLYKNISGLAIKVDWHLVLNRFFNNAEIAERCLNDELFKHLLEEHLPDDFILAHQKYIWTSNLIDFFELRSLIQWESKSYINGFDTNESIEWSRAVFQKYHNKITTERGCLNISQRISDYSLIDEFPDFLWSWEGISRNKNLISNMAFVEKAYIGNSSFSNKLLWNEILSQSTYPLAFWNRNLKSFYNATDSINQILFWKELTQKESKDYIFENSHFPWDWKFITENSTTETILDSFEDEILFEKWDWEIATRKLDKEIILDKLEELARFIDWTFLINDVFTIESELSMSNQLPRIAACLSVVNEGRRKDIWKDLTARYSFELLFGIVEATYQMNVFEWDWDYISNHKYFPTDIKKLNSFKGKINWSVLSGSNAIRQKFNRDSWSSGKEWFSNIDRYLQEFADNWDWQILSRNGNVNFSRLLLRKYRRENWDWEYLSEFGGFLIKQKTDSEKQLAELISQFPKIKFELLSKRKDITLDSNLILSTEDKKWDWQALSDNERAEISIELILKLRDKDWNWRAISKRKKLILDNETLLQLLDKDWDWVHLSGNANLLFSLEFFEQTKAKPWDWEAVSRHKTFSPSVEILSLIKDLDLDWKYLSQHSDLNPTKELLAKFEAKWDWTLVTQNQRLNFTDIDFIERFADKWDWRYICGSGQLTLTNQILNKFKQHLKWDLISANTNIYFTEKIIQEFRQYWNWTALRENKRVEELLGNYVADEISKSPTLIFIDRIEQSNSHWKGFIYHFSHIENAVEIIKNKTIQCRNKASIKGDAAGSVVHLRGDAHDYARFYFRPHTPTQFYNEFLGKNITDGYNSKQYGWISWYEKARSLGFPKCPVPIFFKFSLKEVLFKYAKKCCVSNGNMQTHATQFGSIESMTSKFGFDDLYYTPESYATKEDYNKYRNYAQQEFLVEQELSFDDLADFEIICPSETDKALLIDLLGQGYKNLLTKIVVDRRCYNYENPRVSVEEVEAELHISTNFKGNGYFVLDGTPNIEELEIISGDIIKMDKDKIIFSSNVSIRNIKQNIRLTFVDESGRSWFVYSK